MASNDADPGDSQAQRCFDCGITAPATETNYTLISARHGWRLSLDKGADGRRQAIWRCPTCWEVFRGRR